MATGIWGFVWKIARPASRGQGTGRHSSSACPRDAGRAAWALVAALALAATLVPSVGLADKFETRRQTVSADFTRQGMVSSQNSHVSGMTVLSDEYTIKVPSGRKAVVSVTRTGGFLDGTEEFYVYAFDEYQHYLQHGETRIYTFTSDNVVNVGANGWSTGETSVVTPWQHLEYSVFVDYTIAVAYSPNDIRTITETVPVTVPNAGRSLYPADASQTFRSVVRDAAGEATGYRDAVIGVLELKAGKVQKNKGTAKITGSVKLFDNTKFRFSETVNMGVTGSARLTTEIAKIGTLDVFVTEGGVYGTLGRSFEVEFARIGGSINGEAQFLMEQGDFTIAGAERLFDGLLPNGEPVEIDGRKWITAKPGKVKAVKGSATDAEIEGENLAGLKLSYEPKTGEIKGSFTVYSMTKGKLKKHRAVVLGALVSDRGRCLVTIKDANWSGVASIVGR